MIGTSGLRSSNWTASLPQAAHEKAEETTVSGPTHDRALIGGLRLKQRQAPAPPPQPAPPPEPGPVTKAVSQLADLGLKILPGADEKIAKSFSEKYEALVRIGAPYTMVVSVQDQAELEAYTRLRTGKETPGSELSQTHSKLHELDGQGVSFYFERATGPLMGKLPLEGPKAWLRTDAAGAAILLARGESLRLLGADGQDQKLDSAASLDGLKLTGSAQKKDVRELLDFLESLGKVEADFPLDENILASDYETQYWNHQKMALTSGLVERPQNSDFLARRKMLGDLADGGEVNLTLPGLTRPVPVNQEQAEAIRTFFTNAQPRDFDFFEAYQAFNASGGKIFARQIHGDARGQLVESKHPIAALVNLTAGGECVLLDNQGNLTGVKDLDAFSILAFGQSEPPGFRADVEALEKTGFTAYRAKKADAKGTVSEWDVPGPAGLLRELSQNRAVLVRKEDGTQSDKVIYGLEQFRQYARAQANAADPAAPPPPPRVDPTTPKDNLVLVYYSALHNSDGPLGVYDDYAYKLQEMGSSADRDLVVLRSDRSFKENLRVDYAQPGRFEPVARLGKSEMLSDADLLEDFIYESVKRHPDDKKIRLVMLGHGSADQGVMDDFLTQPDGSVKAERIPVDDLAGAVKSALDRIEQETGKRPVIDNLILNSCLMGNASVLQALAETGDVRALSASPELMLDSFPAEAITSLKGDQDAKEYARQLVDIYKDAGAFPGGRDNRVNALVYGSYDCDPAKAATFKTALKDFFSACTARPDLIGYVRENIEDCPGYNIHPTGGPGPGFDNRDLIQVARRIQGDARIADKAIKQACADLIEATKAQVIAQRGEADYADREGPSFFFPTERHRFDPSHPPTALLRDTGWSDFMTMVQAAGPRTQAHEQALKQLYEAQGESLVEMVMGLKPFNPTGQATLEQQFVSKLEKPVQVSRLRQGLVTALKTVTGALGGALGFVVCAAAGLPAGAVAGAVGGLRGHSLDDPAGKTPTLPGQSSPPASQGPVGPASSAALGDGTVLQLKRENKGVAHAALMASLEGVGTVTNKSVSYRYGKLAGKLAGVPTGMVGGAVTGSVGMGAVGAVAGWQLGQKLVDWLLPERPPRG